MTYATQHLRLAAKLGKNSPFLQAALGHLNSRVIFYDGNDPLFFTARSLQLPDEFDYGEPNTLVDIALKASALASGQGDFRRARAYYGIAAKLRAKSGDQAGASELLLHSAESFITEAVLRNNAGDHLAAPHFWQQAYDMLRSLPGQELRLAEVHH